MTGFPRGQLNRTGPKFTRFPGRLRAAKHPLPENCPRGHNSLFHGRSKGILHLPLTPGTTEPLGHRKEQPLAQPKERSTLRTRQGHDLDVAVSALQKAIRRGQVDDAIYWVAEVSEGGYPAYVWRRLSVIVSEDVGIAEPHMPATIHALYETWKESKQQKRPNALTLFHAVILLARARKSRLVNHAVIAHTAGDPSELYRDPPDVALDKHTKAGRKLGRGFDHFYEEAALLADPESGELSAEGSIPDPYFERAKEARGHR